MNPKIYLICFAIGVSRSIIMKALSFRSKVEVAIVVMLFFVAGMSNAPGNIIITDDHILDDTYGTILNFTSNWLFVNNITINDTISVNNIITPSGDLSLNPVGNVTTESNFTIGNSTNYLRVNETGYLTLHGDSRVAKDLWVDVGGIKAPGLKPAEFVELGLTGVWQFGDEIEANQESVSGTLKIPSDMDRTVVPLFKIGWSADGASPGNCHWQLEYLWVGLNDASNASAQETLTATGTASSTSNGIMMTAFSGIDLPSSTDQAMFFRITRLSSNASDTIVDTVEMRGRVFSYTANVLGEAI
jgi:hypothetical protein